MKKKDLLKALDQVGDEDELHILDYEFDIINPVRLVAQENAHRDVEGLHTCPSQDREDVGKVWVIH